MTPVNMLQHIPLFEAFRLTDRQRLAALLRKNTVKKGEVLFRQGDEGNAFYIIIKGRIKIALTSNHEDEITLAVFANGDFFGEMALLDGLPRSADAIAVETTQLYVLSRNDFVSFLIHNEDAVKSILYVLSMRLRKTDNLLGETAFLNVSVRLMKRLVDLVEIQGERIEESEAVKINITQKELASLVGVSRESINKKLKGLSDKGILTTRRSKIIIKNPDLLKRPYQVRKLV
jgi:CRP/FNR family transcriptional regulator, cyclic AMP receptor protein